jgi:hypothetical protein
MIAAQPNGLGQGGGWARRLVGVGRAWPGPGQASRRQSRRESLVQRDSRRRRVEERFEEDNGAVAQLFSKNVVPMNCQFMV